MGVKNKMDIHVTSNFYLTWTISQVIFYKIGRVFKEGKREYKFGVQILGKLAADVCVLHLKKEAIDDFGNLWRQEGKLKCNHLSLFHAGSIFKLPETKGKKENWAASRMFALDYWLGGLSQ